MKRVPNYKLENLIKQRIPFTNYNATITAHTDGKTYSVVHWNTLIWCFDLDTNETTYSRFDYISQTTSALQGRIIRSLPKADLERFLKSANARDFRRIRGMARL